jgi:hypothetical protein
MKNIRCRSYYESGMYLSLNLRLFNLTTISLNCTLFKTVATSHTWPIKLNQPNLNELKFQSSVSVATFKSVVVIYDYYVEQNSHRLLQSLH